MISTTTTTKIGSDFNICFIWKEKEDANELE